MKIEKQEDYAALRTRHDNYHAARVALCGKRNYVTPEDAAQLPPSLSNDEISALEVWEFEHDKPGKYFAYVDKEIRRITTWTGDLLGFITWSSRWQSNFGDRRVSIRVKAINGLTYSGTFFESAGDYCRLRVVKA